MCETRWQNRKDLTWSGCSGEQGMPLHIRCLQCEGDLPSKLQDFCEQCRKKRW